MIGVRRTAVAFVVAAALSGVGALSVAGAGRYLESQSRDSLRGVEAATVFGVLRNVRSVRDNIPLAGTDRIRNDPETKKANVRWTESRLAIVRRGISVYVVPSQAGVCMALAGPEIGNSLACASTDDAAAGRLVSRIVVDKSTIVIGLARDGICRVTVASDVRNSTQVLNNAFLVPAGRLDGTLSWSGDAGIGTLVLPPAWL